MIEHKRLKAELARVTASRYEIEYQIELKKEEIQRLQNTLEKQEAAELELKGKLTATKE